MGGLNNAARAARAVNWGKVLRNAGLGTSAAGIGTMLYGAASTARASTPVPDMLKSDATSNGASPLWLRLTGKLPWNSRLMTDADALSKYLHERVDTLAKTKFERAVGHASVDPQVKEIMAGNNAAFVGLDRRSRPVFAFPKGRVGRRVVLHEVGHYLAMKKRTGDAAYMQEYARGAGTETALRNLFRNKVKRDAAGNLTRYGMEAEAWDLGGVPESDPLRQAALGSYDGASRAVKNTKAGLGLSALGTLAILASRGRGLRLR